MDETVRMFLEAAARRRGVTVDDLLARTFHIGSYAAATYFADATANVRDLVTALDDGIRLRNPGLHYVERSTFIGYRREEAPTGPIGGRVQIFLSVLLRKRDLVVVLPPKPPASHGLQIFSVGGKGHHGIGDTRVRLDSPADIEQFFDVFAHWLVPAPVHTVAD
jgi:hypothetical protein